MTRVLVLHSGGLDSSVALMAAVEEYGAANVVSLGIDYGQRHLKELEYAKQLCQVLGVERDTVKLPKIEGVMLTDASIEIPKISYDEIEGISPTYVPFRNGLMLSVIASKAQNEGFDIIVYGAHAEDAKNWAYPDCTPEFNGAMANAIFIGTYQKVRLHTPFQWAEKHEIALKGGLLEDDYRRRNKVGTSLLALTWSCYKGDEHHCGTCPTCRARKEAFIKAGVTDPTIYAE